MKTTLQFLNLSISMILFVGSSAFAAPICNEVTVQNPTGGSSAASQAIIDWRRSATHLLANGEVAKTSEAREKWLFNTQAKMEKYLLEEIDTPEFVFAAQEGVTTSVLPIAMAGGETMVPLNYTTDIAKQGYHYDKIPKVTVTGLGKDGILSGTVLLPVSAHTGLANAKKWATTDTYMVTLQDELGTKIEDLAKNEKSLALTTVQEVSFKISAGKIYRLVYYRSGSGGPEGYKDGRILEIIWDGQ